MSILYIFIPESGLGPSCDWALRAAGTLSTGSSAWSRVPQAEQVVLIVAASRVLLTQIKLPSVAQGKLRDILAYAVEDKLLAEPESIHAVAGMRAASGETPLAIIDKTWLREQLAQLQNHGLRPDKMLAETLLPRLQGTAWSLVWNGQGGFVRTGPSAGIVLDSGDALTPPMALTLALEEARAAQHVPERILLYHTPRTDLPKWAERLNFPVEARGAWAWQTAEYDGAAALNLLQGEFAPPRKNQTWLKPLRPALILAGVILVVQVLATMASWVQLRQEAKRLQNGMLATFKQTFPEAVAIVDPALQMRRNLSALRRAHGEPDRADLLPLLALAAPALQAGKIQALQYEQDRLQCDVLLPDDAQLDKLREALAALPLRVELGAPNTTPEGIRIHLSLSAGLGAGPAPAQK